MTEIKKSSVNPLAIILGISALLFVSFMVFSMVYFASRKDLGSEKKQEGLFSGKPEYVAVVELNGVIMESKKILKHLKEAEEDSDIKAVVLRLNSPGGSVAPSQEIYEAVKKYPKPLVITMASVAASGAYYIACGSKKVFANPGTLTGSIGVIMEFANLKKLFDWAKVERFSIKTGKFKDSGAEYRAMSPEEKDYFQELVSDTLEQFKTAVKDGRKMTQEEVDGVADGRVFTGAQAKALKLVDDLGTFEDAVTWVAQEAKLKGKPKLVYPAKRSKGLMELILSGNNGEDSPFEEDEESSSIVDRLVARAADRILGVQAGSETSEWMARPAGIYWIWNGPFSR